MRSRAVGWGRGLGAGVRVAAFLLCLATTAGAYAQDPHAGMQHDMDMGGTGWTFMQDATIFVMFNNQGSPRGETEVKAPNWWMGMGEKRIGKGQLTLTLMLSLDPATVGKQGYSHIFEIGESFEGNALIDHQHPHDFLMQAAAVWRQPLAKGIALTLAGAPVGEPALGPIAFMHRSSAAENPMSPLGHHTFDSSHIAMGVITVGLDRGPVLVESSVFRGQEPDENRWDLMDPGALDSWSVRGWYRPTEKWTFQASHGFLEHPDPLEDGNVRRTTASGGWVQPRGSGSTSVTVAWGRNQKLGGIYDAYIAEMTRARPSGSIFWRVESTQVESDVLRTGVHEFQGGRKKAHVTGTGARDFVGAASAGVTRTIWRPRGWNAEIGAQLTGYAVPASLSPFYGSHPFSFQLFLHVRPPTKHRMVDTTMTWHGSPAMQP
jgi:hypothetical protein